MINLFILLCILILFNCISFCYLFYRILEIDKDIDTLYDNYSEELKKVVNINLEKGGLKKYA